MKTIITSTGKNITDMFDKRFGRAAYFCVLDEESKEMEFHENPYKDASNGAGVKASEMAIELKANKIISGNFGPKAKEILDKFNIQLVIIEKENTISEIIDLLNSNK